MGDEWSRPFGSNESRLFGTGVWATLFDDAQTWRKQDCRSRISWSARPNKRTSERLLERTEDVSPPVKNGEDHLSERPRISPVTE